MATLETPVLMFLGIFVFIIIFFFILRVIYDIWVIKYLMKLFNINSSSIPYGKIILIGFALLVIYVIIQLIRNHKDNKQKSMK